MGRPNQTHERLDALLDGRPGEVTDDLAPLLEAAESLRAELAQFELDPEVADRHLERVLNGSAPVVPLPVRQGGGGPRGLRGRRGLRRRVAVMALAAALVLVPATMASAASSDALPGQALYSVKLAVEQVRLASVQWSATREAAERTRQASRRLQELDKLVQLRIFSQVPPAIRRLDKAVVAANQAAKEAVKEGPDSELAAVLVKLKAVGIAQHDELRDLQRMVAVAAFPPADATKIAAAVTQSPALAKPIAPPALPPNPAPVTTGLPPAAPPPPPPPSGSTPVPEPPPPPSASQPTPEPPVTQPSTPPPVSEPEPSTTAPTPTPTSTTTAPPAEEGSSGAGKSETGPTPPTTGGP